MTGLFVTVGDEVTANTKLLTLEAMKMQSTIYAPDSGRVGSRRYWWRRGAGWTPRTCSSS